MDGQRYFNIMTKRLRKKIDKYCSLCGTQSCNPFVKEDRLQCPYFNSKIKQEQEKLLEMFKNFCYNNNVINKEA